MTFRDDVFADYQASTQGQKASWPRIIARYFRSSGFRAAFLYRLGHGARRRGWRILGGLIERHLYNSTHADISTAAEIGAGLRLPHSLGVVIGHAVRIGQRGYILQNVTLGGAGQREKDGQVQPYLGDDVLVGAGAKVLGPITIGSRSVIGANAVVTHDLPEDCTATGLPARVIKLAGTSVPYVQQEGQVQAILLSFQQRLDQLEARLREMESRPGQARAVESGPTDTAARTGGNDGPA
jgi:serine O-acetyltransferase